MSRGAAKPYRASRAWDAVELITLDRDALEAEDRFGEAIRATEADIVVDMICFSLASARQLHAALAGHISHYLCIGTIWTYGHSRIVPTPEHAPKAPFASVVFSDTVTRPDDVMASTANTSAPRTMTSPA